jgi:protein-disulfide isomerase
MRALPPTRRFARQLAVAAAALMALVAPAPAQDRNWNTTFAATEAGHRVGNPAAATSLVMFVSYTCPHCAEFERQSEAALRAGYIRGGKVSVEMRHFIRNPVDLAAALVVECGPPDRFFARHRAMIGAQDRWMARATAASPAQQQRWSTGAVGARMRAIAADLDFHELMEPHGLTTAQIDRCLSDEARARAIATTSQDQGRRFAITGTPSFLLNGRLLEGVHSWSGLQPELDARS